jgi:hypothetical protein
MAEDTNVQERSGTRLTAMRGSRMEIYGGGGELWLMAACLEVVVGDVWEEEVFVGREAYSSGTPSLLGRQVAFRGTRDWLGLQKQGHATGHAD